MTTRHLNQQQIYFGYAHRHCCYRVITGQLLIRNLSREIEGLPASIKLQAGQIYQLPDSGWMMLTPYGKCEFAFQYAPASVPDYLSSLVKGLRRYLTQAFRRP